MKTRWFVSLLLGMVLLLTGVRPALADGIIIPEPPPPCPSRDCPPPPFHRPIAQLAIKYHHVTVKIEDQIATTHVDQVFYNPNDFAIEGTYVFPLPLDAAVSNFVLWVDGEPVQGQVLDANQARQTYEEIVNSLRDPALLEYVGRGALQASIFPIPPKGDRRIELEYTQALAADNGLVRYVYPLNTEKFSALPLESVSVTVEIDSAQPIRAVYSPSHNVDLQREGDHLAVASYEETNVTPDTDFSLYYSLGETEAFHLLSFRDPADPSDRDGFFMLLLAPSPGEDVETVSKDVLLVLDRSGSMEGEKFQQAQQALRYILGQLNPEDRFYLTSFSSGTETFSPGLRPASDRDAAIAWVDRLGAAGSTDINRALLETASVAGRERPTYLIFLTDGLPTEGVTDSQEILDNFARSAPDNIRLFAFGVGYDVDTFLLDTLAQEHHGLSTYVQPGEALNEVLSAFYARISTPVLTNLELDFGSLPVYDLYPNPLPDLFAGTQVVLVGRYRDGGVANVSLTGRVNGQPRTIRFDEQRFESDSRGSAGSLSSLPRLWATRKIGYLLNKVRLNGADQETVDQIVRLSIRYGIVTPYTSYLVTEPMPLGVENQRQLAEDTFNQIQTTPTVVFGQEAVEKAAGEGALSQADQAPALPSGMGGGIEGEVRAGQTVRLAGSRTFVLQEGVWMDTAYDPQTMKPRQVSFLSDDYFALAQSRQDIAAALALGERVIVVIDGTAYEVVAADAQSSPLQLPDTPAQPESTPIAGVQPEEPIDQPAAPASEPASLPVEPEAPSKPASAPACAGILLPLAVVGFAAIRRLRG